MKYIPHLKLPPDIIAVFGVKWLSSDGLLSAPFGGFVRCLGCHCTVEGLKSGFIVSNNRVFYFQVFRLNYDITT